MRYSQVLYLFQVTNIVLHLSTVPCINLVLYFAVLTAWFGRVGKKTCTSLAYADYRCHSLSFRVHWLRGLDLSWR